MRIIKKYLPYAIILLFVFFIGVFVGIKYFAPSLIQHHYTEKVTEKQPIVVQGETKTVTDTQIAYVPKETVIEHYIDVNGNEVSKEVKEKTDFNAQIGKYQFNVRLNDRNIDFVKSDDEKYMFDKNKIALNQTSTITFDAKVEPYIVDKTKRWSIGIGYGTNGVAGKIDFPLSKKDYTCGWAYVDKDVKAIGVERKF